MKITIEPTTRLVEIALEGGSMPARIWEGTTEAGSPVTLVVVRIAALDGRHDELERALIEKRPPSQDSIQAWPTRLVL